MELHDRIKYLRKEVLKLSQEEFGKTLGVNRDVINNIERNRLKRPEQKDPVYKLICEKFNVSEDWLKDGVEPMYLLLEDEEAIYVSELLEDTDNPLYNLIKAVMKTYSELGEKEKVVLKSFAKDLKENLDRKKDQN